MGRWLLLAIFLLLRARRIKLSHSYASIDIEPDVVYSSLVTETTLLEVFNGSHAWKVYPRRLGWQELHLLQGCPR